MQKIISMIIDFTLRFQRTLADNQELSSVEKDNLTSKFYNKVTSEAARHGIGKEETFNIVLSVLSGGAAELREELALYDKHNKP